MNPKSCYLCDSTENLTMDHVPPKNLFPPPRPKNLITVPACYTCNNSFKLDDEYFRAAMATQGYFHETGKWIWENKVVGSTLRRSPALKKVLLESIIPLPEGHYAHGLPGVTKGLTFKTSRINRVLDRIVRGLFRHHCPETKLSRDTPIHISMVKPSEGIGKLAKTLKRESLGGDTFIYWRGVQTTDPTRSIWLLSFYCRTFFGASTLKEFAT